MKKIMNYVAILAVCFFSGTGNFMNAAIHTFQEAFPNISQSTIMLVSTLPGLIGVPVMLLAGRLVGRKLSYRFICITGTILIILGGMMPYFITTSWAFILVCRAILGIGAGCYGIRNSFIIRSVSPEKQAAFTGYSTVALTLGGTLSGPVVGALATKSWNSAFLYNAVPIIILILVIIGMREPEPAPEEEIPAASKTSSTDKLSWKIYFYAVLQLLILGCLYPMTVSGASIFFAEYKLGSASVAGTVMSLFPLSGVIGNMFLTQIMRSLKKYTIPAMAFLVIISGALCLLFHTMIAVVISFILAGLGYHIIIGVLQVYNGLEAPPSKLAVGSTLILACKNVGIFLSSYYIILCTWIFNLPNRINVENAFLGCIIIYTLIALFTIFVNVTPSKNTAENRL